MLRYRLLRAPLSTDETTTPRLRLRADGTQDRLGRCEDNIGFVVGQEYAQPQVGRDWQADDVDRVGEVVQEKSGIVCRQGGQKGIRDICGRQQGAIRG